MLLFKLRSVVRQRGRIFLSRLGGGNDGNSKVAGDVWSY